MSEGEHTPGPWRWTVSDRICSDAESSPVLVCRLPLSTDKRADTPPETIERWKADAALIAQAPTLKAQNAELVEALETSRQALRDWVHTYAPELCNDGMVKQSLARIEEHGGTLVYIADAMKEIKEALAKAQSGEG